MPFQKGHNMNKGKENPMYGKIPWNKNKKWSEKHKQKLSEIHKTSEKCINWVKKMHIMSKGKHHSPSTEIKKGNMREKSLAWKGGKIKHSLGYIWIHSPKHPFRDCRNYVLEHRLVIENQIKRYLKPEETGHHFGKRNDNRPHMLMAFTTKSAHQRFHHNPDNVKPSEIIFDGRKFSTHV